jgi:hypothetical protein
LRAPPAKRRRTRKGRKSKSNGKEKPEENQPEVTQKESQAQDIEDEKTKERSCKGYDVTSRRGWTQPPSTLTRLWRSILLLLVLVTSLCVAVQDGICTSGKQRKTEKEDQPSPLGHHPGITAEHLRVEPVTPLGGIREGVRGARG